MKKIFTILTLLLSVALYSQQANIKGVVVDSATQEPLAYATVSIQNTTEGVNTDLDGNYDLTVKAGTYTLVFQYMGYITSEKTISVSSKENKVLNISLDSEHIELEGVVVQATRSKSRESALLIEQMRSNEIKQQIGSQELSRKGVSNVAAAVIKTTGVSKQESSGTIFVRGLGDRYNSTSLNGLPLSSNDPERKNIDLNLFSTDIVEYISIDKTYNPRNSGDFAGGDINIISKKHSGEGYFNLNIGSNVNTNALGQDPFRTLSDRSYLGFSNTTQPKNALNNFAFKNSTQTSTKAPYGFSLGANGGKSFFFGEESSLNLFATVSFDNDYKRKEGPSNSAQAQNSYTKELNLESNEYNTNTTAMFNAEYNINSKNSIRYNTLFVNSSQEKLDLYTGYVRDITDRESYYESTLINRQSYKEDRLFVNQLLGDHKISDRIDLNWGAAYNNVSAQTPDRQTYTLNKLQNSDLYEFSINSKSDNNRYFEDLTEDEIAANIAASYKFGAGDDNTFRGKLTAGYNYRKKERAFKATQYIFQINNQYNQNIDANRLDDFFNQSNFEKGYFETATFKGGPEVPNALRPQTYDGSLIVHAGFVNVDYQLSDKFSGTIGARFERTTQGVTWQTQLDSNTSKDELEKNAFLPSLSLKYAINDRNNLRFAASKTYTLPQFKERARFIYEDVTEVKVGNPDLYASDDYNVDLKWEFFPKNDELFSATVFGKYIKNPMNEIVAASASNDITYANTGDYGYAAGLEIEIRKNIISFDEINTNKITGGLNASIMKTYQELDNEKVARENKKLTTNFTHTNASFTGASDLLLNADISYIKEWGEKSVMATASYAHFSDKLYSIGTEKMGNLVDKSFGFLDFAFKMKFTENFGIGINAKNLLDPKIERTLENATKDVLIRSYKLGRNFSLSLNYSF